MQRLVGEFGLKLRGLPFLATAAIELESRDALRELAGVPNPKAKARAVIVGPFVLGAVTQRR